MSHRPPIAKYGKEISAKGKKLKAGGGYSGKKTRGKLQTKTGKTLEAIRDYSSWKPVASSSRNNGPLTPSPDGKR
jgi:hypothetical protein